MKRLAIAALAICAAPALFAALFVLYAWNMEPIRWGQDEE